MSDDVIGRLKYFAYNYDCVFNKVLDGDKKIYLGERTNKICRFCGKSEPEVKFGNFAHAISNLLGNTILGTNYECNTCNSKFSRLLENHLAAYLGIWRTLMNIKGKKGVPEYKDHNNQGRVFTKNNRINVVVSEENSVFKIDNEKKEVTVISKKDTYIPIAVYKCFVKMALSVLPDDEIKHVHWAIEWINEENHKESKFEFKPLMLLNAYTPGILPYDNISVLVFRRKKIFEFKIPLIYKVPYIVFVIRVKNMVYQVSINYKDEEIEQFDLNKNLKICCFPGAYKYKNVYEETEYTMFDLSSKKDVKNEESIFKFKYNDMLENGEIDKKILDDTLEYYNKKKKSKKK